MCTPHQLDGKLSMIRAVPVRGMDCNSIAVHLLRTSQAAACGGRKAPLCSETRTANHKLHPPHNTAPRSAWSGRSTLRGANTKSLPRTPGMVPTPRAFLTRRPGEPSSAKPTEHELHPALPGILYFPSPYSPPC